MATLEVVLDDECGGLDTTAYALTELTTPTKGPSPTRFRSQGQSHNGSHAEIWTGLLTLPGRVQDIMVICKLAEDKNLSGLEYEAKLYTTKLKDLQGIVVPRFYGFYFGTYRDLSGKENLIGCIILEHCGCSVKGLGGTFLDCRIVLRYTIMRALVELHDAGIRHNRLGEGHVLVSDDGKDVRIVDFYRAAAHRCDPEATIGQVYAYAPSETDFKCTELYNHALDMRIWTPHKFELFGYSFSVLDHPGADSILRAVKRRRPDKNEDEMRKEIEAFLNNYYRVFADRFDVIGDPRVISEKALEANEIQPRRRQRS